VRRGFLFRGERKRGGGVWRWGGIQRIGEEEKKKRKRNDYFYIYLINIILFSKI